MVRIPNFRFLFTTCVSISRKTGKVRDSTGSYHNTKCDVIAEEIPARIVCTDTQVTEDAIDGQAVTSTYKITMPVGEDCCPRDIRCDDCIEDICACKCKPDTEEGKCKHNRYKVISIKYNNPTHPSRIYITARRTNNESER